MTSPGIRTGHALDHHVIAQSILARRKLAGDGHVDVHFFSGRDIPGERRSAQVLTQHVAGRVADLQPDRHLSAEASPTRFPFYAACVGDPQPVGK